MQLICKLIRTRHLYPIFKFSYELHSVIATSDHLLDLLSAEQSSSLSLRSIFCSIVEHLRFPACHDSPTNIRRSFEFTVQQLESTTATLSDLADALDDGLDGLERHLKAIRDLASDEAGVIMLARHNILGHPLHILWEGNSLLNYNSRLQAIHHVNAFRNTASVYVANIRSRVRSVGKELNVLRILAETPNLVNAVLPMKAFVQALRSGVICLREAHATLAGRYAGSWHGKQDMGQIDEAISHRVPGMDAS